MKVMLHRILTLLLCVTAAQAAESVKWLGDYQEALAESKKTGKPIFLEFRCEA